MRQARRRGKSPGGKPRRRWRRWLWLLPLLFVALTTLQVATLRFVDPPFSAFMVVGEVPSCVP